jgi:hypothetical protein
VPSLYFYLEGRILVPVIPIEIPEGFRPVRVILRRAPPDPVPSLEELWDDYLASLPAHLRLWGPDFPHPTRRPTIPDVLAIFDLDNNTGWDVLPPSSGKKEKGQ